MKKQGAFTLIELMIVIAIMGILSTIALPTYQSRVIRAQISEAVVIADDLKFKINEFYQKTQQFPANNEAAGLPKAKHLIGNYVTQIEVMNGVIHVHLGNRINAHVKDKILSFRPAVVAGSPKSPIAWVCGYAEAVDGMKAVADNNTNVPPLFLDMACRSWK
ncbi:MAG: prepilin-type N-terminal cleavage/methylation domain-containing protein [Methylococcaceae bacterium]|nr:prepilin-type N-terminal cleavage/methylation domain-containing protein [Methylococcaceae bacterium]